MGHNVRGIRLVSISDSGGTQASKEAKVHDVLPAFLWWFCAGLGVEEPSAGLVVVAVGAAEAASGEGGGADAGWHGRAGGVVEMCRCVVGGGCGG